MKPTSEILERIEKCSSEHKDGVFTRLYRYLLREDIYYAAYQKLYANKGATTQGIDDDKEHRIVYQNNPMLRWCLLNTAVKSQNKEGIESIQPVKAASNRRIDGMVSFLNAWTGLLNHAEEFLPYLR